MPPHPLVVFELLKQTMPSVGSTFPTCIYDYEYVCVCVCNLVKRTGGRCSLWNCQGSSQGGCREVIGYT